MKKSKTLNAVLKELKEIKKLATDLDLESMSVNNYGKLMEYVIHMNKTTKHDYFLDFSGHVNLLELTVYVGGWEGHLKTKFYIRLYLDKLSGDWFQDLIAIINYGIWLYEEKGILYKDTDIFEVKDYTCLQYDEEREREAEAKKLEEVQNG